MAPRRPRRLDVLEEVDDLFHHLDDLRGGVGHQPEAGLVGSDDDDRLVLHDRQHVREELERELVVREVDPEHLAEPLEAHDDGRALVEVVEVAALRELAAELGQQLWGEGWGGVGWGGVGRGGVGWRCVVWCGVGWGGVGWVGEGWVVGGWEGGGETRGARSARTMESGGTSTGLASAAAAMAAM